MAEYYVYIMTNQRETVLYTGMTNDICRRVLEHREPATYSFCAKYKLRKLVYLESFDTAFDAICHEKQIKGGSRKKKELLIERQNPAWKDLFDDL